MNRTTNTGCEVEYKCSGRIDFSLFNEIQSRIIISLNPSNESKCLEICDKNGIIFSKIGRVSGNFIKINKEINLELEKVNDAYYNSISKIMED